MVPLIPLILKGLLVVGAAVTAAGCGVTSYGGEAPDGGPDGPDEDGGGRDGSIGPVDDGGGIDANGIQPSADTGIDGTVDDPDGMVDDSGSVVDDPDASVDSGSDSGVVVGTGQGPNILRPDLMGVPLAPTRAYLRWTSDVEAFTYQFCYTTDPIFPIDDQDQCPNKTSTTRTDAVIDNLQADATYRWKVRFFRDDDSFSRFGAVSTFTTDDSLVGWWKFDEDIGIGNPTVTDSSGNGLDGVLVTDDSDATKDRVEDGSDIIGQALILDGLNDHVNLDARVANLAFDATDPFMVSARVRVDSLNPDQTIFSMFNSAGPQPGIWMSVVDLSGDAHLNGTVQDTRIAGGNNIQLNGEILSLGTFGYTTMTYLPGGASTLELYFNSVSSGACPCLAFTFTGGEFGVAGIGATTHPDPVTNMLQGAIDELAVFRRVLEPEIIGQNDCAADLLAGADPMPATCQ